MRFHQFSPGKAVAFQAPLYQDLPLGFHRLLPDPSNAPFVLFALPAVGFRGPVLPPRGRTILRRA